MTHERERKGGESYQDDIENEEESWEENQRALADIEMQEKIDEYEDMRPTLEEYEIAQAEAWIAEQQEREMQEKIDEYEAMQPTLEEYEIARAEALIAEQQERAIKSFKSIELKRPTLSITQVLPDPVISKIQLVNQRMPSIVDDVKDEIQLHFDEPDWENIIRYTIESSELISAYRLSARYIEDRLFYVRHDLVHALLVTKYSLDLVDLLFNNEETRILFSNQADLRKIKIIVALASLWHDSGNSIDRENHQNHSVTLASPHISARFDELGLVDKDDILIEILKTIRFHTEESGPCHNLESAVVRLADGIDCTKYRCGESGETNPRILLDNGQLTHINGKAGIDAVEISCDPERNKIIVEFLIDPDFIPPSGIFRSSSAQEIEQLINGKLESLKPHYEPLFEITFRSA